MDDKLTRAIDGAIERSMGVPMRWGRNDCALWVASIIRRGLGYDPAKDWRGKYYSARKAIAIMGKGGLPRALFKAAKRHGWTHIPVEKAAPGDVGLCQVANGDVAVVINRAPGWWVGRVNFGYSMVRDDMIVSAWKVR